MEYDLKEITEEIENMNIEELESEIIEIEKIIQKIDNFDNERGENNNE